LLSALLFAVALAACERQLQDGAPEDALGTATAPLLQSPISGSPMPSLIPTMVLPPVVTPMTGDVPTTAAPAATPAPQQILYVVLPGDTLASVSQRYGISADAIAAANGLTADAALVPGATLTIPVGDQAPAQPTAPPVVEATTAPGPTGEQIHVVQAGETLAAIGRIYGFTWQELAEYNNLANPDYLDVGWEIRIPPAP
jgi:LysM repeat protein